MRQFMDRFLGVMPRAPRCLAFRLCAGGKPARLCPRHGAISSVQVGMDTKTPCR